MMMMMMLMGYLPKGFYVTRDQMSEMVPTQKIALEQLLQGHYVVASGRFEPDRTFLHYRTKNIPQP